MPIKTTKWDDIKNVGLTQAQIDQSERDLEEDLLELSLTQLRTELGRSQADLAAAAEMSQGEVSRAERRSDHLVSTLRRIVHGLGGELRVTAVFSDREITLDGV